MDKIFEIIKKRSGPGILIFNMDGKLLYVNNEALDIVPDPQNIPADIIDLCNSIRSNILPSGLTIDHYAVLQNNSGQLYSIKAFLIGGHDNDKYPTHIMILIEKITEKRSIDFEKARTTFQLTKREVELLRLICDGHTNKEISEKLFISEYTVKDHIKNIMQKMNANSRNEIIAFLK